MSVFSIKLKTKAGNDVNNKQSFTAFFKLKYEKEAINVAEFTYRIMAGEEVIDPNKVIKLKNSNSIQSIEEATLRVIINLTHIIMKICEERNVSPDGIMFISTNLKARNTKKRGVGGKVARNRSWVFLRDTLRLIPLKDGKEGTAAFPKPFVSADYSEWTEERCTNYKISKDNLDILRKYVENNPNTRFVAFDPNVSPEKYAKSIHICDTLENRLIGQQNLFYG